MEGWAGVLDVINVIDKLILPIVAYGTFILRDIRHELRELNGRMIKMEEWQGMHEKLDDERYYNLTSRIDNISPRNW